MWWSCDRRRSRHHERAGTGKIGSAQARQGIARRWQRQGYSCRTCESDVEGMGSSSSEVSSELRLGASVLSSAAESAAAAAAPRPAPAPAPDHTAAVALGAGLATLRIPACCAARLAACIWPVTDALASPPELPAVVRPDSSVLPLCCSVTGGSCSGSGRTPRTLPCDAAAAAQAAEGSPAAAAARAAVPAVVLSLMAPRLGSTGEVEEAAWAHVEGLLAVLSPAFALASAPFMSAAAATAAAA
jgi:hypothetical protein